MDLLLWIKGAEVITKLLVNYCTVETRKRGPIPWAAHGRREVKKKGRKKERGLEYECPSWKNFEKLICGVGGDIY